MDERFRGAKEETKVERVATVSGSMMVLYTILVIIYFLLDILAMGDENDFKETMKGTDEGARLRLLGIESDIDFGIKIRVLMIILTILAMIVTWGN